MIAGARLASLIRRPRFERHILGADARVDVGAGRYRVALGDVQDHLLHTHLEHAARGTDDAPRQDGFDAERGSDIDVRRPAEDVADGADLPDATADHDSDRVAHRQRLHAIVGHKHGGRAGGVQERADVASQTQPRRCVERGERLVEQQQPWTRCQRPRQRNPLRFTA